MPCPCCPPAWFCADCCCPDGSKPPASVTIKITNYGLDCERHLGAEGILNGRAPAGSVDFSDLSVNGTYTLNQDVFGEYHYTFDGQQIEGPGIANNCIFYSFKDGNKIHLQAGRWPRIAGTQYYFAFSGNDLAGNAMTLATVVTGGMQHDICSGPATDVPDVLLLFRVFKNGERASFVMQGGQVRLLFSCALMTISH